MGYGGLLLYKILYENDLETFKKIDRKLFFEEDKYLYDLIYNYFIEYSKLPTTKIIDDNSEYVFTDNELKLETKYILQQVRENFSRFIKSSFQRKLDKAKSEEERDKLLGELTLALNQFWNESKQEVLEFEDYKQILANKYEVFINQGGLGIQTGYKTFDILSGGLLPSEIYLILGRLKQGKSQLLIAIVNNVISQNKRILFVSMEMTRTQIFDRLLGIRLGTNPNVYRLGKISPFALEVINHTNIENIKVVEGQFKATISDIATMATIEKPDVLVIDGAYLVRLESKASEYMSKPERLEEIMKTLKNLAHTLNIPILASFQLGRESNRIGVNRAGKETVDKIQWSDAIGQIMTSGLAIYDDKDDPKRKLVEVIRGRHGEDGEFYIHWDFDTGNFKEIEEATLISDSINLEDINIF